MKYNKFPFNCEQCLLRKYEVIFYNLQILHEYHSLPNTEMPLDYFSPREYATNESIFAEAILRKHVLQFNTRQNLLTDNERDFTNKIVYPIE